MNFARLLTKQGYKTETGITIQGQCVSHEVDVVAEKNGQQYPLTCLGFLSQREKQILLERDIVLCQEIAQVKPELLENWGIAKAKVEKIKLLNIFGN